MNKILDARTGTITLIEGPTLSGKTRKLVELLKDAIKHQVPTLFISLELTTEQVANQVQLKDYIYIAHNAYIEKIYDIARTLKSDEDIKLIMIDSLTELYTKEKHCLGQADIRFHILKQLKQLSNELGVAVIMTGPANIKKEIKNINELDIKILDLYSIRKH